MTDRTLDGPTLASMDDVERCFSGAVPAVLATASADGMPNVTYISRAHQVDSERIALSNQFMSKTARNLAVNPYASLLLLDPVNYDEFRLTLVYERTERRGHIFDRLRADIDVLAMLADMQNVYRLRAADVFRVIEIERLASEPSGELRDASASGRPPSPELEGLAELAASINRAGDFDAVVDTTLEGLDRILGYQHTVLLLVDETGQTMYTIASHGFDTQSLGAEVRIGQGQIGLAAQRCETSRVGNLRQIEKYAHSIRRQHQAETDLGRDIPLPGVTGVQSRLVVPVMARHELIGAIVAESRRPVAFTAADEHVLEIVSSLLAQAIEHMRAVDNEPEHEQGAVGAGRTTAPSSAGEMTVRFFAVDGSVFIDGDYLIKGVAGRILWSLLQQHRIDGRVDFTNRELRLDPTLDLPGFKDNLESRLILLKRRLDERQVPIRIEKTGRGRFRLQTSCVPMLDAVEA